MASFYYALVRNTVKLREEKGILRPDMIHLLMEARKGTLRNDDKKVIDTGFAVDQESEITSNKKGKLVITDHDMTAQVIIFFFAGFDTSSTSMCHLANELALNMEAHQKLQDEVDNVAEECNEEVTYEALLGMKYMDMCLTGELQRRLKMLANLRICRSFA